jgi:hypothetical protein
MRSAVYTTANSIMRITPTSNDVVNSTYGWQSRTCSKTICRLHLLVTCTTIWFSRSSCGVIWNPQTRFQSAWPVNGCIINRSIPPARPPNTPKHTDTQTVHKVEHPDALVEQIQTSTYKRAHTTHAGAFHHLIPAVVRSS